MLMTINPRGGDKSKTAKKKIKSQRKKRQFKPSLC